MEIRIHLHLPSFDTFVRNAPQVIGINISVPFFLSVIFFLPLRDIVVSVIQYILPPVCLRGTFIPFTTGVYISAVVREGRRDSCLYTKPGNIYLPVSPALITWAYMTTVRFLREHDKLFLISSKSP